MPNTELKAMVEAYKTRAPQAKENQPRESAREKLDALVKDTAAKVSPEKPKSKTKSKKDPELSNEEAAAWAASIHIIMAECKGKFSQKHLDTASECLYNINTDTVSAPCRKMRG